MPSAFTLKGSNARGDVNVLAARLREVFAPNLGKPGRPGNPNEHAERAAGVRATTRNWNVVCALAERAGR